MLWVGGLAAASVDNVNACCSQIVNKELFDFDWARLHNSFLLALMFLLGTVQKLARAIVVVHARLWFSHPLSECIVRARQF